MADNTIISAQVILRPASGRSAREGVITAETLGEYLPDPETAGRIRDFFQERGFEAGQIVGNSFSITASAETFEKVFATTIGSDHRGGATWKDSQEYELPVAPLGSDIASAVETITFTPPPDFGPTSY